MLSLAVNWYSEDVVRDLLHYQGDRHVSYRYELLDVNNIYKGDLREVKPGGSVTMDATGQIKRSGQFAFRYDGGEINWETDKIKPFFVLRMPDGGVCEWPLGVFYLVTPVSGIRTRHMWHEVEVYDRSYALKSDSNSGRTYYPAGTLYTDAVGALLVSAGIITTTITPSTLTMTTEREWPIGTPKLEIIATLLKEINYRDLYVDANGIFVVEPYVSPWDRVAGYTYKAGKYSVVAADQTTVQRDSFDIPNVIIGVVSNPDTDEMKFILENTNPTSPVSIPSRGGRRVVHTEQFDGIASASELEAATRKLAAELTEVHETVSFQTAMMPHHGYNDILLLESGTESGRYAEQSWTMTLQAGALMSHACRKVVLL